MHKNLKLYLIVFFACLGAFIAWYTAVNSREAQLARGYLLNDETIVAKYGQVTGTTLVGFRLSLSDGSQSYFTFWVETLEGRKFIKLKIDKRTYPWGINEVNTD